MCHCISKFAKNCSVVFSATWTYLLQSKPDQEITLSWPTRCRSIKSLLSQVFPTGSWLADFEELIRKLLKIILFHVCSWIYWHLFIQIQTGINMNEKNLEIIPSLHCKAHHSFKSNVNLFLPSIAVFSSKGFKSWT